MSWRLALVTVLLWAGPALANGIPLRLHGLPATVISGLDLPTATTTDPVTLHRTLVEWVTRLRERDLPYAHVYAIRTTATAIDVYFSPGTAAAIFYEGPLGAAGPILARWLPERSRPAPGAILTREQLQRWRTAFASLASVASARIEVEVAAQQPGRPARLLVHVALEPALPSVGMRLSLHSLGAGLRVGGHLPGAPLPTWRTGFGLTAELDRTPMPDPTPGYVVAVTAETLWAAGRWQPGLAVAGERRWAYARRDLGARLRREWDRFGLSLAWRSLRLNLGGERFHAEARTSQVAPSPARWGWAAGLSWRTEHPAARVAGWPESPGAWLALRYGSASDHADLHAGGVVDLSLGGTGRLRLGAAAAAVTGSGAIWFRPFVGGYATLGGHPEQERVANWTWSGSVRWLPDTPVPGFTPWIGVAAGDAGALPGSRTPLRQLELGLDVDWGTLRTWIALFATLEHGLTLQFNVAVGDL